jgi:hypothetical protein
MYSRIRLACEIAPTDDYANARIVAPAELLTVPTLKVDEEGLPVPTTGIVIDTTGFATATTLLVVNTSVVAAEIVNATWFDRQSIMAAGNVVWAANTITNAAGGFLAAAGLSLALAANAWRYNIWARGVAAEDVANRTAFAVTSLIDTVVTLNAGETATVNAADTAVTLSFEHKNVQDITPGSFLLLNGVLAAQGLLTLQSRSGTPTVNIYALGT